MPPSDLCSHHLLSSLISPSYKEKMHYSSRTRPQLEWSLLFHLQRFLFQTKPCSQHPVRQIFGDHHFDPAYLAHVTSMCTQISQIFSAKIPITPSSTLTQFSPANSLPYVMKPDPQSELVVIDTLPQQPCKQISLIGRGGKGGRNPSFPVSCISLH